MNLGDDATGDASPQAAFRGTRFSENDVTTALTTNGLGSAIR